MEYVIIYHAEELKSKCPASVFSIIASRKLELTPSIRLFKDTFVVNWILNTYINLVLKGIVKIGFEEKKHGVLSIFSESILYNFLPTLKHLDYYYKSEGWLEQKIIDSIDCSAESKTELVLKKQIRKLIDSIFGKGGTFINPYNEIAEKLLNKVDEQYWTILNQEKIISFFNKIKIEITEENKQIFSNAYNDFEFVKDKNFVNQSFNELYDYLRLRIEKEINKRQDLSD